jgi:hypothetical protein
VSPICLSCGCGDGDDSHAGTAAITLADLQRAADAAGISLFRAAANILQTVTGTLEDNEPEPEGPEQRFLLGVAYQPGRDPRIAKGLDGGRDFFTPAELEKAAWSFMQHGQQHGLFHLAGTEGAAVTVENSIYRNPLPWVVSDDLIVRKGTWLQGLILDEPAWQLYKDGRIGGLSPQGGARRRRSPQ